MISKGVLILFVFILNLAAGQEPVSDSIGKDSTSFLYEFDMKYIGSSVQVAPNYYSILDYLVELLNKNPKWTVHVRGHVCCGPSLRVSKRRAKKAYQFLKRSGIDKSRLSYKGYNDLEPLAFPEKTEEDERINRRVDFIIYTNK